MRGMESRKVIEDKVMGKLASNPYGLPFSELRTLTGSPGWGTVISVLEKKREEGSVEKIKTEKGFIWKLKV